ncbi:MAG: transglutaminase domain-containing protein [Aquificota bacterium]|nr:transglutaminase domain-containing protein [Aquificota bacterium]
MAHVWVEAYVNGRWIRVDTTPPYLSPGVRRISRWDLLRDAIVSFWYENVVDFSAEKQVSIAKALRSGILEMVRLDAE